MGKKQKKELDEDWWCNQTINILTRCINDLVYAYENKYFDLEEMKKIDFEARKFSELIPSFMTVEELEHLKDVIEIELHERKNHKLKIQSLEKIK